MSRSCLGRAATMFVAVVLLAPMRSHAHGPAVELEGYFARPEAVIQLERRATASAICPIVRVAAVAFAEIERADGPEPASGREGAAAVLPHSERNIAAWPRRCPQRASLPVIKSIRDKPAQVAVSGPAHPSQVQKA